MQNGSIVCYTTISDNDVRDMKHKYGHPQICSQCFSYMQIVNNNMYFKCPTCAYTVKIEKQPKGEQDESNYKKENKW